MAHGGHSTISGSDSLSDFLKNIFHTIKALPSNFVKLFQDDDYDGLCVRCGGAVQDPTFQFCSQTCAALHWDHVRQVTAQTSNQWICRYPTCTKPCYTENDGKKRYDYCGIKHAQQHKALMEEMNRQVTRDKRISYFDNSATYYGGARHPWGFSSDNGPILFYDKGAPYYQFTNFYPAVIILDGLAWPTTEHYFQAQKFIGTPFIEIVRSLPSPRDAFEFSRRPFVAQWRRSDWEQVKINIMRKALLAKFSQYYDLRKQLLQTGMRTLIEDSPYDSFWGIGRNGQGENHLGKLLMEVRDEIRKIRKGDGNFSFPSNPQVHQSVATDHVLSGNTAQMDHALKPKSTPPHSHQVVDNGSQIDPNLKNPIPTPDTNVPDSNVNGNALDENLTNDTVPSPQVQNKVTKTTTDPTLPAAENESPDSMNQQSSKDDKSGPNGHISSTESGLTTSSVTKPEPVFSQQSTTDLNHNMGSAVELCPTTGELSNCVVSNIVKKVIDSAKQRVDDESADITMDIGASGVSSNEVASTVTDVALGSAEKMEYEESTTKQPVGNQDQDSVHEEDMDMDCSSTSLYYYVS